MPMERRGMMDRLVERISPPFYQERTFLVLIGLMVAGAGFVAVKFARSRWVQRRRWPMDIVSEAVLVVDLVDSTHLATHYGDHLAMHARNILKDRTMEAAQAQGLVFAENTGDGYFMTFPSVAAAVQTAISLLTDLKDRPPDMSPAPPLEVRAGISYGEILIDKRPSRHGAAINKAFRIGAISQTSFTQLEQDLVRDRNRIFLDEEAANELRVVEIPLRSVGFCSLKGFSGLHRVFEVPWDKQE